MIEYTVKVYEDSIEWYLNGKLHREDGPAIEWADGGKEWFLHGKRHREDGPAIEWADGGKFWFLNGIRYSEEEWKVEIQKRNGAIELTVGDIEKLLGKKVKIVKEN